MKLEDVLAALGEEEHLEAVSPHWDESQVALPEKLPDFLEPAQIVENMKGGLLADYMKEQILAAAKHIADDPNLLRLAWHCYRLQYHHTDYKGGFANWPSLEKSLGRELHGIFYLLVGMGMVPIVRAVHAEKNVDEQITRDTLSDVRTFNWRHRKACGGRLGIVQRGLPWFTLHTSGELYRVGRMQYYIHEFPGLVEVYRNRKTNEVLALAPDGIKLTPDGYYPFGDNEQDTWTTELTVDTQANTVTGYPVSPHGVALRKRITLDLGIWRHKFGKGTGMLSMHIPAGGTMSLSQCVDSMRKAFEFFPKIFPDRPFVGIDCNSWIFGTQLEDILEPDSNLVEYLREGYLFPVKTNPNSGHFFIFYRNDGDLEKYPRENDFQQRIYDWLAAGRPWRNSGWFVLKEDAEHFGRQYYRSHWPPRSVDVGG